MHATRPTGEILRQLITREQDGLFSDAIIARTSAMLRHLGEQLLLAAARASGETDHAGFIASHEEELGQRLSEDGELLAHCHALAVESALADTLHERAGIDPALPPLLKDLLASEDRELAAAAMHVLAAQARFLHTSRRMELPLGELPAELFRKALTGLQDLSVTDKRACASATGGLSESFDEANRRVSHFARLHLMLMERDQLPGAPGQTGLAIFASILADAADDERDAVILAAGEGDPARLKALLDAAQWPGQQVRETLAILHPHADGDAGHSSGGDG